MVTENVLVPINVRVRRVGVVSSVINHHVKISGTAMEEESVLPQTSECYLCVTSFVGGRGNRIVPACLIVCMCVWVCGSYNVHYHNGT